LIPIYALFFALQNTKSEKTKAANYLAAF